MPLRSSPPFLLGASDLLHDRLRDRLKDEALIDRLAEQAVEGRRGVRGAPRRLLALGHFRIEVLVHVAAEMAAQASLRQGEAVGAAVLRQRVEGEAELEAVAV